MIDPLDVMAFVDRWRGSFRRCLNQEPYQNTGPLQTEYRFYISHPVNAMRTGGEVRILDATIENEKIRPIGYTVIINSKLENISIFTHVT